MDEKTEVFFKTRAPYLQGLSLKTILGRGLAVEHRYEK